jgi:hypothetical protein
MGFDSLTPLVVVVWVRNAAAAIACHSLAIHWPFTGDT